MSSLLGLACDDCRAEYSDREPINTCPGCGGLLEAIYDQDQLARRADRTVMRQREHHVWRWKEFLPVRDDRCLVTLGEGGTPLHRCDRLAATVGVGALYVKDDTIGPTGSLKDRSFAVAIGKALELGIRRAVTYTSGNAGGSFAAYCARAGLQALILVNEWTTEEKLAMMQVYGHPVIKLRWKSFAEVTALLARINQDLALYQFTNFFNPFRHEGMKTYAYEVAEALGWRAPDRMVHPIGTGGGIHGAWKGFRELQRLGWIDRLPKMTGVQPEATPAIVRAFREGRDRAEPCGDVRATIAQSIAADAPLGGGRRALRSIRESGGTAEAVSDAEIREAIALLGREGIFAEPAGASSVAAAKKLARTGEIGSGETVVCVVTGSGLKQPHAVEGHFAPPPVMECHLEQFTTLAKAAWGESPESWANPSRNRPGA